MVLQRRLDNGFNGYRVPVVPRASRSARGRGPVRRKCEKKRAFEILASVAEELLLVGESSASIATAFGKDQCNVVTNPVQWEQMNRGRFLKVDPSVGGSYEKSFACMPELRGHCHSYMSTEFLHAQENFSSEGSLASDHFGYSETLYVTEKLVGANTKNAGASPSSTVSGDSTHAWKVSEGKVDGAIERKPKAELLHIRSIESGTLPAKDSLEDAIELGPSPPGWACEESNLKASLFRDCIGLHPFSMHRADMKVVNRVGAESSVGCSQNGTIARTYRPLSYAGDQRIKNLSTSRDWRVAPNLKSGGYFRNEWKTKPILRSRGTYYSYQRSQKVFPFKKRKFFDQSPLSTSDGALHCEDIFNSPDESTIGDNLDPATEASSSVAGQQAPLGSRGCNVKLSIKSFKVPELLIEIPTAATVGLLKRTVMEAVTGILGDGLHVGVLLQGKKVRDVYKTLLQTGISKDDKHGNLGFELEPRHAKMMPPPYSKNPPNLSGNESGRLARHTTSLMLQPGNSCASPVSPEINFGSSVRSDLGAGCSLARTSADDNMSASQALVAVPAIGIDALSVVPLNSKSVHPEFGQRRIRRPFTVSEVEALVRAVEKLGTGRWRDVKLRAFDKANHRTYVDLKDKWKTLVHTARISPQQRRGEPMPQELLDRVLAAHAYWSYWQAKQLVKAEA